MSSPTCTSFACPFNGPSPNCTGTTIDTCTCPNENMPLLSGSRYRLYLPYYYGTDGTSSSVWYDDITCTAGQPANEFSIYQASNTSPDEYGATFALIPASSVSSQGVPLMFGASVYVQVQPKCAMTTTTTGLCNPCLNFYNNTSNTMVLGSTKMNVYSPSGQKESSDVPGPTLALYDPNYTQADTFVIASPTGIAPPTDGIVRETTPFVLLSTAAGGQSLVFFGAQPCVTNGLVGYANAYWANANWNAGNQPSAPTLVFFNAQGGQTIVTPVCACGNGTGCGANETCQNGACVPNPTSGCNPPCTGTSTCVNGACVSSGSSPATGVSQTTILIVAGIMVAAAVMAMGIYYSRRAKKRAKEDSQIPGFDYSSKSK